MSRTLLIVLLVAAAAVGVVLFMSRRARADEATPPPARPGEPPPPLPPPMVDTYIPPPIFEAPTFGSPVAPGIAPTVFTPGSGGSAVGGNPLSVPTGIRPLNDPGRIPAPPPINASGPTPAKPAAAVPTGAPKPVSDGITKTAGDITYGGLFPPSTGKKTPTTPAGYTTGLTTLTPDPWVNSAGTPINLTPTKVAPPPSPAAAPLAPLSASATVASSSSSSGFGSRKGFFG